SHCSPVDILIIIAMSFQPKQSILAYLNDTLRAGIKSDNQWPCQIFDGSRNCYTRHQRYIAGFNTSIGKIDRRGRFGCTRNSHKDDVGFFKTFDMLPIIVQHREVERVDTLEILRVQDVLRTGPMNGFGAEIRLEEPQDWPQYGHARQSGLAALFLQQLNEVLFEQRVENQARRFRYLRQCMVELFFRSDHWVEMFNWRNIGVLRRCRPGDGNQSFTRGIGNQVKMEITGLGHLYSSQIACGYYGRRPRLSPTSKPPFIMSSFSIHITAVGTPSEHQFIRGDIMWIFAWGMGWIA